MLCRLRWKSELAPTLWSFICDCCGALPCDPVLLSLCIDDVIECCIDDVSDSGKTSSSNTGTTEAALPLFDKESFHFEYGFFVRSLKGPNPIPFVEELFEGEVISLGLTASCENKNVFVLICVS